MQAAGPADAGGEPGGGLADPVGGPAEHVRDLAKVQGLAERCGEDCLDADRVVAGYRLVRVGESSGPGLSQAGQDSWSRSARVRSVATGYRSSSA